jgi:L,D-transpeptidase ErfK/SrfK
MRARRKGGVRSAGEVCGVASAIADTRVTAGKECHNQAMRTSSIRLALAAGMALAAGACSLLRPPPRPAPPPPPPKVVPPPLPLPTQTEKFVLAPGQDVVGAVQVVRVLKGQTLTDIGRRFNLGYEEMTRANPGVDPWIPAVGTPVVLPTQFILPDAPHRGIVVNLAAMRLFYFPPHKRGQPQVVITHPVGIGRRGFVTPQGVTHVMWHEKDPVWEVPASILAEHAKEGAPLPRVVGPGPENPLGNYALHLGWPGYLIHGTNKPVSVGWRVSHGCIHLFPEDIKQIFYMVPNGTEVRVVNQPYVFGWRDGRLYMAAYGPLQGDKRPWKKAWRRLLPRLLTRAERVDLKTHGQKIDWTRVAHLMSSPRGVPVPISGKGGADLEQLLADAPRVQNRLPAGSTWDGKTDLPLTNTQYRKIYAKALTPAQRKALAAIDEMPRPARARSASPCTSAGCAGGSAHSATTATSATAKSPLADPGGS